MLLKNQMKSAMMAKPADKNVQSGNSRVKVTIYGQVNRAIRFASSGGKSDIHSVDNGESNSRIGFRAVGKLNENTTAVALSEWAMAAGGGRSTGFSDDGAAQGSGGDVSVRHSVVDLVNKDLGTLSLGHSVRADASAIFTGFQGASIVFHGGGPGAIDGLTPSSSDVADDKIAGGRLGVPTNVYPGRENRLLYRTPNLMGVSLAASVNQAKSWSFGGSFKSPASLSKDISLALGFGYRSQPNAAAGTNTFGVSGGVQHNPSGLSVNGVFAQEQIKGGDKHTGWAADLSWTGKLMGPGSTSLTIGYGQYRDGEFKKTNAYWLAVNQRVDSAAADLYFGVSYDTGNGQYSVQNIAAVAAQDAYISALRTTDATTDVAAIEERVRTTYALADGVDAPEDGAMLTPAADNANPADGETPLINVGADGTGTAPVNTLGTGLSEAQYHAAVPGEDAMPDNTCGMNMDDDTLCSVKRQGVLVILAGVRIKF